MDSFATYFKLVALRLIACVEEYALKKNVSLALS